MKEIESKSFDIKPDVETTKNESHNKIKHEEIKIAKLEELESSQKNIDYARELINSIDSNENHKIKPDDSQEKSSESSWTSKELLGQTYAKTLSSVRNRLSKPEKTLSKVIHQPVVEKINDALENTVARPSGILFGGVFSLIGSGLSYLLAVRLGGEMPNSVFAIFFIGGFAAGLVVEFLWRLFKKRKNKF